MKRAKPGSGEDDTEVKNFIDGFADTRNDPIKRRKIHRVLDFVQVNREAYRKYLKLDEEEQKNKEYDLKKK